MWYEDVVCQLNKEQVYTRQQIYEALVNEKPELTYNSFKWIISQTIWISSWRDFNTDIVFGVVDFSYDNCKFCDEKKCDR